MKFTFFDVSYSPPPPTLRREWAAVIGGLSLLAVLYLSTLRDGHAWGDDFAQYIRHAKNIVEGRDYTDTGYIYNPDYGDLGPRGYPPGLPLFLAPIIAVFGVDYTAMKILLIAAYFAMNVVLWRLLRRRTTPTIALAALAVFALNPWNWNFKDTIASENLYLLWVFSAVCLFDGEPRDPESPRKKFARCVLIGAFSVLAAVTRTTGILIFPLLLIVDRLSRGTIRKSTVLTTIGGLGAYFLLSRTFPGTGSYLDQLEFGVIALRYRAEHYLSSGARWFFPELPMGIAVFSTVVVGTAAIAGWIVALFRRPTVCDLMFVGHFASVCLWPSHQGTRFLFPLLPFVVEYVLCAVGLFAKANDHRRNMIVAATAAILIAAALSGYSPHSITRFHESYDSPEWRELKEFVAQSTPKDAVFLFRKPRLFALETDRRCGTIEPRGDMTQQWKFADAIGAAYFVRSSTPSPEYKRFRNRSPERLHTIFSNRAFVVERISSAAGR